MDDGQVGEWASPSRSKASQNNGSYELHDFADYPFPNGSTESVPLLNSDPMVVKLEGEPIEVNDVPASETEILMRQIHLPIINVGYRSLYRYATVCDIIIITISSLCAISGGAALPLMTVIFGQLSGVYQGYFQGTLSRDEFNSALSQYVLYFVYLAIGEFFTIYISMVGFIYTGEHITRKIREQYLAACLRQNMGFFDVLGAGELTTRLTAYTGLIQDGISEKVGLALSAIAAFVAAFVIGFVKYWKLTLILAASVVATTVIMAGTSKFIVKYNKMALEAYAIGGSVAEEVLSSICNATAFGTQDKFAQKYDKYLIEAERWGFKVKLTFSIMIATISLVMYLSYGLGFWQGAHFLVKGEMEFTSILTILLATMIGALSLANVAPIMQSFSIAVSAAASIFCIIDRDSPLNPLSHTGKELPYVDGTVEFRNVKHIYPLRPFALALNDFNLVIPAGKRVALVGASGSGKSTVVDLIQRFYEPVQGQILLDGHDIDSLNLRWLRQQISVVSQDPILFGTTVFENIKQGLTGTKFENESEERKRQLVIEAAKRANAHDFIECLPASYHTYIGQRLLSGGQRQRISIARAIVGDPKILLLDEATSSLDTESEGIVQAALEAASAGRTTLTIAHRLSTIKDADVIVVMADGCIIEQGSHNELLQRGQIYHKLVEAQKISRANGTTHPREAETKSEGEIFEFRKLDTVDPQFIEDSGSTTSRSKDLNKEAESQRLLDGDAVSETSEERNKTSSQSDSVWSLIKLIAIFGQKEWKLMLLGLFFCIICGAGNPIQTLFFAEEVTILSFPVLPLTVDPITKAVKFWCLMYLILAFVQFVAFLIQGASFAFCSERLIRRLRDRAFRVLLRQDISFFDENSVGSLISFLSIETNQMAGLSGTTLGTILTMLTTLVAALVLAFVFGWKLALVTACTIPFLLASGFLQYWILAQYQLRAKKAYEASAGYACEAISAIRTVASLTRELDVWSHYHAALIVQSKNNLRSVLYSTLLYALSQSLIFLCMALGFWYGGTLVANGEYNILQIFVCFPAIVFGAQSAGTIFSFAPDMSKAQEATRRLKNLFDRRPVVDSWSESGHKVVDMDGSIEFRDVHFRYPIRPEQPVLRGLNLTVTPGEYAAIVGVSGCGKSTVLALLARFYDPLKGSVYVDGKDVRSLNVNEYRSFIALVSQEPALYQGTIRENMLLGVCGDDKYISDSTIEQACKEANIYDFIMSLPDGLSTNIGSKGNLLSGGQKQRMALARALLRNPKILLLDEATSALDSESEQLVQTALDAAAKGRTTIAVAHRLSTIQKADVIYVLDHGEIVEQGQHADLIARGGRYAELVSLQNLGQKE